MNMMKGTSILKYNEIVKKIFGSSNDLSQMTSNSIPASLITKLKGRLKDAYIENFFNTINTTDSSPSTFREYQQIKKKL